MTLFDPQSLETAIKVICKREGYTTDVNGNATCNYCGGRLRLNAYNTFSGEYYGHNEGCEWDAFVAAVEEQLHPKRLAEIRHPK